VSAIKVAIAEVKDVLSDMRTYQKASKTDGDKEFYRGAAAAARLCMERLREVQRIEKRREGR
jgi:hypothetical protein